MNVSRIFIERPIGTALLAAGLFLAGAVAYVFLPVASMPTIELPTIRVSVSRPGADPATMAASVAAPLERRLGEIAGVTEMTSSSSLGSTFINIQFDLGRSVDGAGGNPMLELRQQSFDPIDGIDDVGLRLFPDDEQYGRLLVETCRRETIAGCENNFSDVADAYDVAVRQVLDDNILVVFRVGHLLIGLENDRLSRPVDRPDRREVVGSGDSDPDVFEADAHLGNQRRIDLNAGGRLVGAADRYVRNAIDL
jgi:hypothetical protein